MLEKCQPVGPSQRFVVESEFAARATAGSRFGVNPSVASARLRASLYPVICAAGTGSAGGIAPWAVTGLRYAPFFLRR
jgi:hypothetical protein